MINHMDISQTDRVCSQVQGLLAEVFQVPLDQITPDLAFGDLPEWNSLGHMDVMMRLEDEFGAGIDTDTIAALVSVPAICAYLAQDVNKE